MNYYRHHIGDFNGATRHLSRVERAIYRDLLELYYDIEGPLTADVDRLARRCLVPENEMAELRHVLDEFFTLSDDGYHNSRADREIAEYHKMAEGGRKGAQKRWAKHSPPIATPSPPVSEANANHKPITNNHKPEKNTAPEGVAESVWQDFKKLRTGLRAPITPTAMAGIQREADKAGISLETALRTCCERGWRGFKADWLVDRPSPHAPPVTVPSRPGIDPAVAKAIQDAKNAAPMPAEARAKLAELRSRT